MRGDFKMATTKETKVKENVRTFLHKDNPFFFFTCGRIKCQFVNSEYKTSNEMEIRALEDYMYNTNDLMMR